MPQLLHFPAVQPALTNGTYTTPLQYPPYYNNQNRMSVMSSIPSGGFDTSLTGVNTFTSPAYMQPAGFATPQSNFPQMGNTMQVPPSGLHLNAQSGWGCYPMGNVQVYGPNAGYPTMPLLPVNSQPGMQAPSVNGTSTNHYTGSNDNLIQYLLEEQRHLQEQLNERAANIPGSKFGKPKFFRSTPRNTLPRSHTPLSNSAHQGNTALIIHE